MVEFSLNPIKYITRVWAMGKIGRILVITTVLVTIVALYIWFSVKLNGFGLTATLVLPIGLWVLLGILSESPRLKIVFGGSGRPGREDVGDHPYHVGGAIFEFVATISNTGGKKLTLEPKMVLRDKGTMERLYESPLMPRFPIPKERAIQRKIGEFVGKIPEYCPELLVLEPNETKKYSLGFFVDKDLVDMIGVDEHDTIRVYSAEYNLKFIDRGLGIAFECVNKGRNKFECKRSRFH